MKKIIFALALLTAAQYGAAQQKKAVFIIVDGIPKDVIEKVATPRLDEIAKEGGFLSAHQGGGKGEYSQTPTISAPGYNNVLTGTWFNKHNVPDNAIKAPNYHYPTIFRLLKDQHPGKKTAIFSSWIDNRTKLVGEGLPQTGNIQLDHHFDGLELDTQKYPHDKERTFMSNIDQAVADEAAAYITQNGPDLTWVYMEFTDDMGHMYGDGEQMDNAVKLADQRIGKIWDAIKQRQKEKKEDWLIMITTDHGRDVKTGKGHGGQSDRERNVWITTNARPLNAYAKSGQAAVVDILPTIARFMDLTIPQSSLRELDGIPLTGKVSLMDAGAVRESNSIKLSWKPVENEGKVKIWLSTTNQVKESGKEDQYKLIGEVPLTAQKFEIDLSTQPASEFYKIVLEGKYNSVNKWVVKK